MFTEGSKAIYCLGKIEEVVDIIKIHPDSITIFIPSIQRERDTLPEKLKLMEEKKVLLELPKNEETKICYTHNTFPHNSKALLLRDYITELKDNHISLYTHISLDAKKMICGEILKLYPNVLISNLYTEVVNLESRDKVLLENQHVLLNQIKSLQETVNSLKKRDEEREIELWTLLNMFKEQKMIHELELKELRKLLKPESPKELLKPYTTGGELGLF